MRTSPILMAPVVALLAACGGPPAPDAAATTAAAEADGGYLRTPALAGARVEGGALLLEGAAAPGARVTLADAGGAAQATADAAGRWRLTLPLPGAPRLLAVSAALEDRIARGPGDLFLTPDGRAAVLRAGGGAMTLAAGGPARVTAFDFDREGAAIVSGSAPAGAALSVRIDGRQAATGRAGADGRFSLTPSQPIGRGTHRIEVVGDSFLAVAEVDATPETPAAGTAFQARALPQGMRVDWTTPGGGVQSTWILD